MQQKKVNTLDYHGKNMWHLFDYKIPPPQKKPLKWCDERRWKTFQAIFFDAFEYHGKNICKQLIPQPLLFW